MVFSFVEVVLGGFGPLVGIIGGFCALYNWDFGGVEGGEGVYLVAKCEYVSIKVW